MKGYLKTTFFAIVIFAILWYFIGSKSALDFVEQPELVFGLSILIIVILINSKIRANLRKIRAEKKYGDDKDALNAAENDW